MTFRLLLSFFWIALLLAGLAACNRKQAQTNQEDPSSTTEDRCALVPEPGPCRGAFQRYYYDREEGACKVFIWGGCDGVVPFETLEACQTACGVNR